MAGVAGVLDQVLPTLPHLSFSLAWIPAFLVGAGVTYGALTTLKLALEANSWADFRESLLAVWAPFDPADHGGKPQLPEEDPSWRQLAQEIRQTQLRQQRILNHIKEQLQAEIQECKRAQAQLRSEQQRFQILQAQAQWLKHSLQTLLSSSTCPPSEPQRKCWEKVRQLRSQIKTLQAQVEQQRLQLRYFERERAQLQQEKQKLQRLLQRTKTKNQELRSQQEQWAQQLAQTQQQLQTLQSSYRALQVLQEVEMALLRSKSA